MSCSEPARSDIANNPRCRFADRSSCCCECCSSIHSSARRWCWPASTGKVARSSGKRARRRLNATATTAAPARAVRTDESRRGTGPGATVARRSGQPDRASPSPAHRSWWEARCASQDDRAVAKARRRPRRERVPDQRCNGCGNLTRRVRADQPRQPAQFLRATQSHGLHYFPLCHPGRRRNRSDDAASCGKPVSVPCDMRRRCNNRGIGSDTQPDSHLR